MTFREKLNICTKCDLLQEPSDKCPIDNDQMINHARSGQCPANKYVQITVQKGERPHIGVGKMLTAARTIATMPKVSPERTNARVEICKECDKARIDSRGMFCSMCGCSCNPYDEGKNVFNLAVYEERVVTKKDGTILTISGCKYPGGSKWKKNGV